MSLDLPAISNDDQAAFDESGSQPDDTCRNLAWNQFAGRSAYFFTAGDATAVTLDPSGDGLPRLPSGIWKLSRSAPLGETLDLGIAGIHPTNRDLILRSLATIGYFVVQSGDATWARTHRRSS